MSGTGERSVVTTRTPLRNDGFHELKVAGIPYFERILDGTKTFEVRKDDRGFSLGDTLWLREWNGSYTGRSIHKRVTYIFAWDNDDLGTLMLTEGTVVMGLGAMRSHVGP